MKFRNNKGFVGIDTSIAIMILVILIPTITAIMYNINKENKSIERKSQALNFAINVMETSKGMEVKDLSLENLETEITDFYGSDAILANTDLTDGIINIKKDKINYNLEITIQDYNEKDETVHEGVVKEVKVIVTYLVGGKEEAIDLATPIS